MISCRTEIEETMLRPADFTVHTGLQGIKVTTLVSEYEQGERPVDVTLPDGNRDYGVPYIFESKRSFTLVDEYPSVDVFRKAIESERLIQLTRNLASFLTAPAFFLLLNSNGLLAAGVISGLILYSSGMNVPFSRLKLPRENNVILDSEIYAFTHTYPDQKLRNYNPWNTLKKLLGGSKTK